MHQHRDETKARVERYQATLAGAIVFAVIGTLPGLPYSFKSFPLPQVVRFPPFEVKTLPNETKLCQIF